MHPNYFSLDSFLGGLGGVSLGTQCTLKKPCSERLNGSQRSASTISVPGACTGLFVGSQLGIAPGVGGGVDARCGMGGLEPV